ncbi:MAG: heme-binding protein [Rhodocyclaceae bacterium]|nr:heme-binding protein [Rhodocyclaceae bacterium]
MSKDMWRTWPSLTADGAQCLIDAADAEARRMGLALSLAVVDAAGVLLAFRRSDGAPPASADAAIGKAGAALAFGRPSGELEDALASRPALATLGGRTMMRGGLPLRVGGGVAGAIGVSGARPEQDEAVAIRALAAMEIGT